MHTNYKRFIGIRKDLGRSPDWHKLWKYISHKLSFINSIFYGWHKLYHSMTEVCIETKLQHKLCFLFLQSMPMAFLNGHFKVDGIKNWHTLFHSHLVLNLLKSFKRVRLTWVRKKGVPHNVPFKCYPASTWFKKININLEKDFWLKLLSF